MANQIINLAETDLARLQQENAQLRAALAATRRQIVMATRCRTFEILTREGLEMQWQDICHAFPLYALIYFDVDSLKILNSKYGITAVNQRIYRAFSCVRDSELVGKAYNGDEFIAIVPTAVAALIRDRIIAGFHEQGISVTCAMSQAGSADLATAVRPLVAEVERLKRERDNAAAAA